MGATIRQIDRKTEFIPFKGIVTTYFFRYKFKNMPYLVADKYGNFFMIKHCPNKRTIPFKMLKKGNDFINYNGNQIRLSTLRRRVILENSIYLSNKN